MKRIASLVAVVGALLLAAASLYAGGGEPPPLPTQLPESQPSITTLDNGQPAAVIPLSEAAPHAAARAIAAQAADNVELVAKGEVSVAQATRDPSKTPFDLGDSSLFWVLTVLVFGPIFRPVGQVLAERAEKIDNRLGSAVNAATVVAFYSAAYGILRSSHPELPQTWSTWMLAGAGGAGVGGPVLAMGRSVASKVKAWRADNAQSQGGTP